MSGRALVRRAGKPLLAAAIAATCAVFAGVSPSRADTATPSCEAPLDLVRLAKPLTRVAKKLNGAEPVVIVAIGSSSTQGAGASSPTANYPNRLAVELARHFPRQKFKIINEGVGGEQVPDMLRRFDKAVIAAKPDLVLWQLGTNSVIRDDPINDHGALIRKGLRKIRAIGADVVLIDPQFAPKVIAKKDAARMVSLIAATAKQEDVDLFRRYDVMKRWHDVDHIGFDRFVAPDGLHMNDWSYACMAKGIGIAIAEAARRPIMSATVAK